MPVWMVKQLCPATEYRLWKSYFNVKWQENNELNYEFAMTREAIYLAFAGKSPEFNELMLSGRLKEPEKLFSEMTEDEQAEAVKAAKARRRLLG